MNPNDEVPIETSSANNTSCSSAFPGTSSSGTTEVRDKVEESTKRSKKHKRRSSKDDSKHHSSHKKHRRDTNLIAQSSKIAIATAEKARRLKNAPPAAYARDLSSIIDIEGTHLHAPLTIPAGGFSLVMSSPSPYFHPLSYPTFDQTGVALPVSHQSSLPLTLPPKPAPATGTAVEPNVAPIGFSAFSVAEKVLFSGSVPASTSAPPPSSAPAAPLRPVTTTSATSFHATFPFSQLTEQQFRYLQVETNSTNKGGPLISYSSARLNSGNTIAGAQGVSGTSGSNENPLSLRRSTTSPGLTGPRICAQNTASSVRVQDLRSLFDLPLVDAAKHLGMCTTLFKKICRMKNIGKWPYRKIHSLTIKVESLKQYIIDCGVTVPESMVLANKEQIDDALAQIEHIKMNTGDASQDVAMDLEPYSLMSSSSGNMVGACIRSTTADDNTSSSALDQAPSTQSASVSDITDDTQNDSSSSAKRDPPDSFRKRRRFKSSYDLKTGWVANCSSCGRLGKYRHPTEGRVFQHSSGTGKYCGYFRDNPRRVEDEEDEDEGGGQDQDQDQDQEQQPDQRSSSSESTSTSAYNVSESAPDADTSTSAKISED